MATRGRTPITQQELSDVVSAVNDAIRPLLRLDKEGQTTDYDVAVALTALAQVAGGLIANKSDEEDGKLISLFWEAVTTSTKAYREMVREIRQQASGHGG